MSSRSTFSPDGCAPSRLQTDYGGVGDPVFTQKSVWPQIPILSQPPGPSCSRKTRFFSCR